MAVGALQGRGCSCPWVPGALPAVAWASEELALTSLSSSLQLGGAGEPGLHGWVRAGGLRYSQVTEDVMPTPRVSRSKAECPQFQQPNSEFKVLTPGHLARFCCGDLAFRHGARPGPGSEASREPLEPRGPGSTGQKRTSAGSPPVCGVRFQWPRSQPWGQTAAQPVVLGSVYNHIPFLDERLCARHPAINVPPAFRSGRDNPLVPNIVLL